MNFIESKLRSYWLHESSIYKIECENSQITLLFKKGFWNFDHTPGKSCRMIIEINTLTINNVDLCVSVEQLSRWSKKNISFNNFEKKLHKHEFYIDVEYYSEFERSILLHGKFQNHDSVLKITDINNISFIYE